MAEVRVRIDDELQALLETEVRRTGLKRSELVRQALLKQLRQPSGGPCVPLAERMRHLIGVGHSGIPDLAERHSEYVLEQLLQDR